ncbi:hypothetical protein CJ030_MR7G016691 [Morella rubra]|uniref:Putative plant transposon protein domain-containing protein n=1 Tax=Morella rubra TaxID=262757 RepID=A0A6A1UZH5_9ROSI|nr:hypothetical protein CJ030_MR7G016691 [Morella rubra]
MSSSRHTRSSQRTPASVASKGKKKARTTEEPTPSPEDYIYRSGLCKNRFVQDFRNRKVIHGRWIDFEWFSANGFDFQDMFEFQGWETLVSIKENCYVYLVKLVFANFQFSKSEDADSYVNGKMLDLSSSSLNSLANAPDDGKKFFENHGWVGLSEVDPLHILRVVLDNPTLDEIIKPTASDLSISRRILHHMVCNIILPRTGKFEYITFLDLFVMYCLITRTPMNLGHLMLNHMKAANEKKNKGCLMGCSSPVCFTFLMLIWEVKYGNLQRHKEYNQKT